MNNLAKSAIVFAFACPAALGAQSRTVLAIAAGHSYPMGAFRDIQKPGFDVNVGVVRGAEDSPFGVRLDFGYDRLSGKTAAGIKSPDKRVVAGTVNGIMNTAGRFFRPYLLAGAGAFKMTSRPAAPGEKTRFGFDFGAGLMIPLSDRAIFVESRLNSISQHNAKPLRYMPVVLGVLF